MADDFAMRHRARRAALLADVISRSCAVLAQGADPAAMAARFTDEQWETVAAIAGIRAPSSTSPTRELVVGLLSVPEQAKGLIQCR